MIENTWTAIVTPFTSDNKVDLEGLNKNLNFQISEGIIGVVAVGTTGESPTLTWEEHNKIIDFSIKTCKNKIGVVAGTGSNSTEEAIENSVNADKLGADGVLLVDCYYNGPSSSELREEYYLQISNKVKTECIPYVIPGRSGTALMPEDLAILANTCSNINAVKDATGDFKGMARVRKLCGDNFSILSGDDDLNCDIITNKDIRGNGVISVVSNIAPKAMTQMVYNARNGNIKKAEEIQSELSPLCSVVTVKAKNKRVLPNGEEVEIIDKYRNPVAIKTIMQVLGMPSGKLRKPLGKMSKSGLDILRDALVTVMENTPYILTPINDYYNIDIKNRISDDNIWNSLL